MGTLARRGLVLVAQGSVVGRSLRRSEGREKVSGETAYAADLRTPGVLWARLVGSPHAHARVLAVHRAAAERCPGVVAVLTADDLGGGGLLARGEALYCGQPVAVVVADDPAGAEDAAEAVAVDYEVLPAAVDPAAAMLADAPLVVPSVGAEAEDAAAHGAAVSGGTSGEPRPRNVSQLMRFGRGDVARGWDAADVVLEGTYTMASVHQGFMETHGCEASPAPGGGVGVWTATQGTFAVRSAAAAALRLPEHRVRVAPAAVGGGFGGKIVLLEPLVAALARRLRRPVRLVLDRTEEFLMGRPAPQCRVDIRLGARRDGTLVALQASLAFDSGCAPGAPVGVAALLLGGTYRVEHLQLAGIEVLTHKVPVGAYRAPGAVQAYFALESHLDRLARRLGCDPLDLRLRNAAAEGDPLPDGRTWPRIGLVQCLERVREHPLWRDRPAAGGGEGCGLAVGGWFGGIEPAAAACRVNADGSLTVQVGSVDITGTHTTMAMIAAEVFGLAPEQVQVAAGDTDAVPYAGMAGGSKITYTVGLAVLRAAEEARAQLLQMAARRLEASVDDLVVSGGRVAVAGAPSRSLSVAELAADSMCFGSPHPPLHGTARTAVVDRSPAFAAHVARVRVDRSTGMARVTDYLAVQDVGAALNPAEVAGQIHGGVAQGIGRALLERLAYGSAGQLENATFLDYQLPTSADVPRIEVDLVEVPSAMGPFGAKGVGEPPAIPGPAAVANAVEEAVGVRLADAPISPEAVVSALRG